jgi:GT2 family glycosyltransferase
MTHQLLGDLAREAALSEVIVVDNGGDYPAYADELVLRPGTNLGWAGGTNLGTTQRRSHHRAVVWLNNDTRLSQGFLTGLLRAHDDTGAGIVAPTYDCFWRHQQPRRAVPVDRFRPRRRHYRAAFVDGTCMSVAAGTIDAIGVLDEETFAPIGWGADLDYCFRAAEAGIVSAITRLAYLHHEKSVTGKTVYDGIEGYATEGHPVLVAGLESKWGSGWRSRGGIDPATAQTSPTKRAQRIRRRTGSAAGAAV